MLVDLKKKVGLSGQDVTRVKGIERYERRGGDEGRRKGKKRDEREIETNSGE